MKKPKESSPNFRAIWAIIGLVMFLSGISQHDWFLFIGGIAWNFNELQIVLWQGKEE